MLHDRQPGAVSVLALPAVALAAGTAVGLPQSVQVIARASQAMS
jgi:hypothetical protein